VIVYVDTSALLKRVIVEDGSDQVRSALRSSAEAGDLLASSALTWVEVERALRRAEVRSTGDLAEAALAGIDELPLDTSVLERARTIGPSTLRSLDALHLASAVTAGADLVMTFDARLALAARIEGMDVVGAPS
jgi:predicted nucleic acid-binding protein